MAKTATFTHIQQVPFKLALVDGLGQPLEFEDAQVSVDDPTVAVVEMNGNEGVLRGIAPTREGETNRLTVTVDAKMGEGVETVTAMGEFVVRLDERPGAKILAIDFGAAVDQAVQVEPAKFEKQ